MKEDVYLPSSVARWIVGAILETLSALNTLMRFGGVCGGICGARRIL